MNKSPSLYLRNLPRIGQGCRRKSYSGNLILSLNYKNTMSIARSMFWLGKLPLPTITLSHPPVVGSYRPDKIFGDIPARLQSFTPASVMHYANLLF